ncbi:MAG: NADH-quinone oxidoreductase subunit M [Planctomycetes bacterium]|nr:NADH-quinone oxidoreductase subunit M [Planctomycetota bacterium]
MLTTMVFAPTLGALAILFLSPKANRAIKSVALVATAIPAAAILPLLKQFETGTADFQLVTRVEWIPFFNIHYFVGVDGISITMVVLTAMLSFLCVIASWNFEDWHSNRGIKGYFALFLLLETGMMGVFVALDFFLFYVFWEVMLLPMYFLIGIWGGPRREYAAIKFFLYTLFGSVLMLVVMLAFYFSVEPHTFSIPDLMGHGSAFKGTWWLLAFIGLFIGFAIKVPVFPFHTWLPDAHVEAPTPISVILAGVLLKMGTYGLLRISYPILPEAARQFAPVMMMLGVINIIYGALCAMAQIRGVPRLNPKTGEMTVERDWKKLIAYSSVSHMGFCLIGMAACTPAGITGAVLQMWNHGCITSMLFMLVGVVYDRAHHRDIDGFGGLWAKMPAYGSMTALAFMASLGLPGLSGFVSEVLCFIGAFQASGPAGEAYFFIDAPIYYKLLTGISVLGVVFGAAYFLWSYQKVFLGPLNPKYEGITDMTPREHAMLWPLAILVVLFGIFPAPIINLMTASVEHLVRNQVRMPWIGG